MDKRLKVVSVVGLCGGIAILLLAVPMFILVSFIPQPGSEGDIYAILADLGMAVIIFLVVFLLSSYVVYGLAGVATILALKQQITRLADAALLSLASSVVASISFALAFAILSLLTSAYWDTPNVLSDPGTAFVASVILLFIPGTAIACITGAIAWVLASKLRWPEKARPEAR